MFQHVHGKNMERSFIERRYMDFTLTRLGTWFDERAFSHARSAAWNALPEDGRAMVDPAKFRKQ